MQKKTALIVFPDEWLQYSPTILNLEKCLSNAGFEVTVIAFDNDYFQNDGLVKSLIKIRLSKWKSYSSRKLGKFKEAKAIKLQKELNDHALMYPSYDLVIGVDSIGFLAAKQVYPTVVFLSLEVNKDEYFIQCLKLGFTQLIIQTEERKEYLIGDKKDIDVSYIQNAPILYKEERVVQQKEKSLLYVGKVDYKYGLESFIEALGILPEGYTLTLKGFKSDKFFAFINDKYKVLIENGRLLFDFEYTPQEKIIQSISCFSIGITGYDLELAQQDFNYLSSPAGKLFNYYAAGLPVIGIDIIGLKSVQDFDAGILIGDVQPKEIARAIAKIEGNYKHYGTQSGLAAQHFDFQTRFDEFLSKTMPS